MNFDQLAQNMTPDIYSRIRESVELGRWPNGVALTKEQKGLCIEAMLKYEISHNIPEHQRTGYLEQACKSSSESIPTVDVTDDQEASL
ncbi:DUF1315 family protein [Reinekea marina]|uniref:YeaC family protein n=1 Tax=Reinekea marina TaxID=1310421 RepID=A0ABV7WPV8_9GAMM|nr:DUF1315 family protein [Reinekea marina]MDN3649890.1 DUF1315 family protein [Reinekea marina]